MRPGWRQDGWAFPTVRQHAGRVEVRLLGWLFGRALDRAERRDTEQRSWPVEPPKHWCLHRTGGAGHWCRCGRSGTHARLEGCGHATLGYRS